VFGWLQVAGVAVLAGVLVPGMAAMAVFPALVGLAVAAAPVLDRACTSHLGSAAARRTLLGLAMAIVGLWVVIVVLGGGYLAAAVSYYRPLAIVLIGLGLATGTVALAAAGTGRTRWVVGALAAVAVGLKLAHWGYYVPEWNYRRSQGPWGRAIGQWVPPSWPIYTFHAWPADLAFYTGRSIRQLPHEKLMAFLPKDRPHFVLLLPSEFEHWPDDAPKLTKVRTFQDEWGRERILARTPGKLILPRPGDSEPE
ncbi:MAG: hypothetical protein IRY99_21545, partial [Isosphaeraceae bacterium]|nr:hypothetical protein [Isosphaeraceae bacterium]